MSVQAGGAKGGVFLSVQALRATAAGMVVIYRVQVGLVAAAGATPAPCPRPRGSHLPLQDGPRLAAPSHRGAAKFGGHI